jgi:hypothetical protein
LRNQAINHLPSCVPFGNREAVILVLIDGLQQFANIVAPRQDVDLAFGPVFQQVLEPCPRLAGFTGIELVVAILVKTLHQRALDFDFVQSGCLQRTAEQHRCSSHDER